MADDWNNKRLKFIGNNTEPYELDGIKIRKKLAEHLRTHFRIYFRNMHRQSLVQLHMTSIETLRQSMQLYSEEFPPSETATAEAICAPDYDFDDAEEDDALDDIVDFVEDVASHRSDSPGSTQTSLASSDGIIMDMDVAFNEIDDTTVLFGTTAPPNPPPVVATTLPRRQPIDILASSSAFTPSLRPIASVPPKKKQQDKRVLSDRSDRRCPFCLKTQNEGCSGGLKNNTCPVYDPSLDYNAKRKRIRQFERNHRPDNDTN